MLPYNVDKAVNKPVAITALQASMAATAVYAHAIKYRDGDMPISARVYGDLALVLATAAALDPAVCQSIRAFLDDLRQA
jgi:hypothetical protein